MNKLHALQASHFNILRAAEIAIVGGHSLAICYSNESIEQFGSAIKRESEFVVRSLNEAFQTRMFDTIGERAQINMEVSMPDYQALLSARKLESLSAIMDRINDAKDRPEPESNLSSSCEILLKVGAERLGFSSQDVMDILEVAKTIARLDGRSKVEAEHIAEAIQYKSIKDEEVTYI